MENRTEPLKEMNCSLYPPFPHHDSYIKPAQKHCVIYTVGNHGNYTRPLPLPQPTLSSVSSPLQITLVEWIQGDQELIWTVLCRVAALLWLLANENDPNEGFNYSMVYIKLSGNLYSDFVYVCFYWYVLCNFTYAIGTNIQLLLMQILEVSIFFVNRIWTVSFRLPVQTEFKINSNILIRWHKTGNTWTKQVCRRQLNIHMRSIKHNADYVKTYVLLRFRETC